MIFVIDLNIPSRTKKLEECHESQVGQNINWNWSDSHSGSVAKYACELGKITCSYLCALFEAKEWLRVMKMSQSKQQNNNVLINEVIVRLWVLKGDSRNGGNKSKRK